MWKHFQSWVNNSFQLKWTPMQPASRSSPETPLSAAYQNVDEASEEKYELTHIVELSSLSFSRFLLELDWRLVRRLWFKHSSQPDRNLNKCSVMRQTYLDSSWWRAASLIEGKQLSETLRFISWQSGLHLGNRMLSPGQLCWEEPT